MILYIYNFIILYGCLFGVFFFFFFFLYTPAPANLKSWVQQTNLASNTQKICVILGFNF